MLGMVKVRLQAGEIVELDDGGERIVCGHHLLVRAAVLHAVADVKATNRGNPGRGGMQRVEHGRAVGVGNGGFGTEQDDVEEHRCDWKVKNEKRKVESN